MGDEPRIIPHEDELKAAPGFHVLNFERQRFWYLVAVIAVALTDAVKQGRKQLVEVLPYLRDLVCEEMKERWEVDEDSVDYAIMVTGRDYSRLIFGDREANRALTLEWAQDWLKRCGIEETNPIRLFQIGQSWLDQYATVAEVVRRAQLGAEHPASASPLQEKPQRIP